MFISIHSRYNGLLTQNAPKSPKLYIISVTQRIDLYSYLIEHNSWQQIWQYFTVLTVCSSKKRCHCSKTCMISFYHHTPRLSADCEFKSNTNIILYIYSSYVNLNRHISRFLHYTTPHVLLKRDEHSISEISLS